jgi:hypothetical protein
MLLVFVSSFAIRADEKTLLIELEPRSEALPTGLSASGAVVSGGFNEGKGGFLLDADHGRHFRWRRAGVPA